MFVSKRKFNELSTKVEALSREVREVSLRCTNLRNKVEHNQTMSAIDNADAMRKTNSMLNSMLDMEMVVNAILEYMNVEHVVETNFIREKKDAK